MNCSLIGRGYQAFLFFVAPPFLEKKLPVRSVLRLTFGAETILMSVFSVCFRRRCSRGRACATRTLCSSARCRPLARWRASVPPCIPPSSRPSCPQVSFTAHTAFLKALMSTGQSHCTHCLPQGPHVHRSVTQQGRLSASSPRCITISLHH